MRRTIRQGLVLGELSVFNCQGWLIASFPGLQMRGMGSPARLRSGGFRVPAPGTRGTQDGRGLSGIAEQQIPPLRRGMTERKARARTKATAKANATARAKATAKANAGPSTRSLRMTAFFSINQDDGLFGEIRQHKRFLRSPVVLRGLKLPPTYFSV